MALMNNHTSVTTHLGDMRCHTTFIPSDAEFTTDVATAAGGRGEMPTPGDMLAATLASCMLSMVAYSGRQHGFETAGISIRAACGEGTRGVGSFELEVNIPFPLDRYALRHIEKAVDHCPVATSLHPDIPKNITWNLCEEV